MRRRILLSVTLLLTLALGATATSAATYQASVVRQRPVSWTPNLLDGAVWAMTVVDGIAVVGGDFTEATSADGRTTYDRWYLMAFDLGTGAVTAFAPQLDGPVWALAPGPDHSVIVGGDFSTVNNHRERGITRLNLNDGQIVPGFDANVDGDVRSVVTSRGWIYVGGWYRYLNGVRRVGLARINAATGALDQGFDAGLADPAIGYAEVEKVAVTPDDNRLAVIGAFSRVYGADRAQLALLDTSGASPRLADWSTTAYEDHCRRGFDTYLRGVDFSPDGSYFVVVTTGGTSDPERMCDSAARFETGGTGDHDPTWVNLTGGNSLYAVAATGAAVYVGGHQRWLDNPYGHKAPGPGAVERPGIAALDPRTGRALSWNPTRSRGEGLRAFAVTPQGLLVGSDTDELAHEYHGRIGMFPLAG